MLYEGGKYAVGKAGELISRARGKPLEQAIGSMRMSAEELAKAKAGESLTKETAEARRLTEEQARRGVAQRGVAKQLEAGADIAKQESVTALNKIARPSSDFELGTSLREKVVVPIEKQLKVTADRSAKVLKDAYFAEGRASEKSGVYWENSQTGQQFMKYLRSITDPANSGKFTQYEVSAAQNLMRQLRGREVEGAPIKATIEKIEKVIRDTKKLPSQPTMTGADALKQQYMGKLAQKLEDSVYGFVDEMGKEVKGFAPSGRLFRQIYSKLMEPLNTYESPVGQMLTKEVGTLKGIYTTDASQIPAKVFQSPEQIRILEKMDVSKKTLEPYATQYTSNQLSKMKTAKEVEDWLKSNQSTYLQEFPSVLKKAQDYAKTFAKNEAAITGKTEAAARISEFARKGPMEVKKEISDLRKMGQTNRDYVSNGLYRVTNAKDASSAASQARSYVLGLKERNIISTAESDSMISKIAEVERQIKDRNASITALKGVLPYAGAAIGGGAIAGYSLNKLIGGLNAP